MSASRRPRRYTRDSYLPASVLARQGRCEVLVVLEAKEGETVTPGIRAAREAGVAEHAAFHKQVSRHHNRGSGVPDSSPCFIASAVYGLEDCRTNELRRFRDSVLLQSVWLAWTVRVYYAVSPPIAKWLSTRPRAAERVALCLDVLRTRLVHSLMEE